MKQKDDSNLCLFSSLVALVIILLFFYEWHVILGHTWKKTCVDAIFNLPIRNYRIAKANKKIQFKKHLLYFHLECYLLFHNWIDQTWLINSLANTAYHFLLSFVITSKYICSVGEVFIWGKSWKEIRQLHYELELKAMSELVL